MKKPFLLWLMLCICSFAYTQVITIKDSQSKKPIELVALTSDAPKAFVFTNSLGQADIASFKGAQKIAVQLLGYKSLVKSYSELQSESFTIYLEADLIAMDEVIISATRWNQSSKDIPSKISSISSKEVQLQNPQTAADLLNVSGEVFIQKSQQGGGSPMIRGFATNRLLYTVDGVRMNTAIYRSGNLQNVISLDPFSMERTEVFFGPGSVIYGSDAIGGVMSFQTLTPQLSVNDTLLFKGSLVSRYSSANNETTGHLDLNFGKRKIAFTTGISYNKYNDLTMGSYGPDEYLRTFFVDRQNDLDVIVPNGNTKSQAPSAYSQINLMQKIRFKPNKEWDFQYGFHYSETSNYDRYDRHLRTINGSPQYGEWYYGPQKWMMNNLSATHSSNNKFYNQMTIRMAHQYFEESRISRNYNNPTKENRIEEVHALSTNIDFNKLTSNRNTLFYGVEVVYNDVVSTGLNEDISTRIVSNGPSRYPQSNWSSYGVYMSNQFKISEKVLVQAGIRYNQYVLNAKFDTTFYPLPFVKSTTNNGALTGSLGFVYRPSDKWVISTNAATGFRSPNVDDMGKVFDSEPGAVVIPNPELKAENAYNVDLGIAKIFRESIKIDVTGYYTILQNAMVRRDFTLNGQDSILYDGTLSQIQAIQNAAKADVYGIQAGIEIKLPLGLSLSSKYNFQKGEEELSDGTISPSRHAAPWFGNTKLMYSNEKLTLQFYVSYSGERTFSNMPEEEKGKTEIYAEDSSGNPYSPAWYTLNFKSMYRFTNNFTVNAGIENITDQRYRPYSSGLISPGRNFIISFKANF